MVSRRKFTISIGLASLNILLGCDNKVTPLVESVPDIFSLFWTNPTVKLLSFLKIINTTLSKIYQSDIKSNTVTVRFETINPGVNGLISLSLKKIDEQNEEKYCDFIIPNDNMVTFSPSRFMSINNLEFGDDSSLNRIDNKLLSDYTQCNDEVLEHGDGNQIIMWKRRAECFDRKGYNKDQLDYMKIKYHQYAI